MVESVGIIGAGTMGNGIAQVCAVAGLGVTMVDVSDAAIEEFGLQVAHRDRAPGCCEQLGDAVAHGAGAHYPDPPDVQRARSTASATPLPPPRQRAAIPRLA